MPQKSAANCFILLVFSFYSAVQNQAQSPPSGWSIRIQEDIFGPGTLQVKYNNEWGYVCYANFGLKEAMVVCNSLLGTKPGAKLVAFPLTLFLAFETKIIWLANVKCTGEESDIFYCSHRPLGQQSCYNVVQLHCGYDDDTVVRLDGGNETHGRVEVGFVSRGFFAYYGSVCSTGFDRNAAKVVCRQLGLSTEDAKVETGYGEGERMWINAVQCAGDEKNLFWCIRSDLDHCPDRRAAAVSCGSPVTPVTPSTGTDLRSNVLLYGGIIGGVIATTAVIVLCVCFVKSRSRGQRRNPAVNGSYPARTASVQWTSNQGSQINMAPVLYPVVIHAVPNTEPQDDTDRPPSSYPDLFPPLVQDPQTGSYKIQ